MLNIILMGPPGAGKGTHATHIKEDYNLPHISTGDMFRAAIAEGTPLGKKAAEIIDKGNLVPDEITIALVKERLSKDDCKNGFLLDGFPRTLVQADALEKLSEEIKRPINLVLNFDCPEDILTERILSRRVCPKCGASYNVISMKPKVEGICDKCSSSLIQRKDDNKDAVKVRLEHYYNQTAPLLQYYEERNLLKTLDGTSGYENVKKEVKSLLEALK